MSSSQVTYDNTTSALPPIEAQESFAESVDMSPPGEAMTSYQKMMHEHTKQQFAIATASSSRRSDGTGKKFAPLSSQSSAESSESS